MFLLAVGNDQDGYNKHFQEFVSLYFDKKVRTTDNDAVEITENLLNNLKCDADKFRQK